MAFAPNKFRLLLASTICSFAIAAAHVPAVADDKATVTVVLPVEPESLDPSIMVRSVEGQVLSRNIFETLTDMRLEDNVIVPRLATAWERIDSLTWRFHLREGVKFHDGTNFDAKSVIYSIERMYSPKVTPSPYFANVKITGVATDPYTVEIKSAKPEPLIPTLMTFVPMVPAAMDISNVELIRNPIGTGPYKLTQWEAGQKIVEDRFDGYWGDKPAVQKATYIWRNESAVRASMVALGEADIAPDIAFEDATDPATDKSYLNSGTVLLRITGFDDAPFNDRRVRLALNYAVDRTAIIGSIVPKQAVPSTQPNPPGTLGFNGDLKPWPFDPDKARELLKEAKAEGVPVDSLITIPSRIGHFAKSEEIMEAVADMLTNVGFNVKLVPVETGVFRAKYVKKPLPTTPHIIALEYENSSGDASFGATAVFACDGIFSRTCDKTLDAMIQKAALASGEERRGLFAAVFKHTHDEMVTDIDLYHEVLFCRIGQRIKYIPTRKTGSELQLSQIAFAHP